MGNCAAFSWRYSEVSMGQIRENFFALVVGLVLACALPGVPMVCAQAPMPAADDTLSLAVCPIVYPLDQSPSDRGFHYLFYGNGFFINEQGYLLTAAHVLSQLTDQQPYIVLRLPMAPPRLLPASVVAVDRDHDVALLRVTPNPFEGRYQVRFLPLAVQRPPRAQPVSSAALRPSRLKDPHTFDAFVEDRPNGQVVDYEFSQLDKGRPDTELLLFSHDVLLGDSGAPVVSGESQAVVGMVEGRWLRPAAASMAMTALQSHSGVGAAIPIHYAIPLLLQHDVRWHTAQTNEPPPAPTGASLTSRLPAPISLLAAPYPFQALQGGEVILDAQVDRNGLLTDIHAVQGKPPFVDDVLSAVQTWSFKPAASSSRENLNSRVAILFQFASPTASSEARKSRNYDLPEPDSRERAALALVTTPPNISANSNTEASVILVAEIDSNGVASHITVVSDLGSLAQPVIEAVRNWQFSPAKCAGANCDSEMILVVVPRQYAVSVPAHPKEPGRSPGD
jgi:S1-C subfamily serine protease